MRDPKKRIQPTGDLARGPHLEIARGGRRWRNNYPYIDANVESRHHRQRNAHEELLTQSIAYPEEMLQV